MIWSKCAVRAFSAGRCPRQHRGCYSEKIFSSGVRNLHKSIEIQPKIWYNETIIICGKDGTYVSTHDFLYPLVLQLPAGHGDPGRIRIRHQLCPVRNRLTVRICARLAGTGGSVGTGRLPDKRSTDPGGNATVVLLAGNASAAHHDRARIGLALQALPARLRSGTADPLPRARQTRCRRSQPGTSADGLDRVRVGSGNGSRTL